MIMKRGFLWSWKLLGQGRPPPLTGHSPAALGSLGGLLDPPPPHTHDTPQLHWTP